MKNRLFYIICVLLLSLTPNLFAQNQPNDSIIEKNEFGSNWYIEAGGGAQILFSKDANYLSFRQRITPAISLTAGKWFSPSWGLRMQVQGYGFNGYSTTRGIYLADPLNSGLIYGNNDPVRQETPIYPDGSYRHYLRYINLHMDFQFSMLNLINSRKEHKWDIIPAIGLGYMHLFPYKGTPRNNIITANFSVMGKYRLNKNFDINLEVQTAVMPDQFDGRIAGRAYENNCAVTLGVTYHFKKRGFKSQKPVYIPTEVIRIVKDIDTVVITKTVEVEVEKKVFNQPFLLTSIRFDFDKDKPQEKQDMLYVNIVKYLESNPRAYIRLDGYADPIGQPDYNRHLSMRRAMSVRKILIDKYGVDTKRIEVQGIGADGNPYEKKSWNRVVIVTAMEK